MAIHTQVQQIRKDLIESINRPINDGMSQSVVDLHHKAHQAYEDARNHEFSVHNKYHSASSVPYADAVSVRNKHRAAIQAANDVIQAAIDHNHPTLAQWHKPYLAEHQHQLRLWKKWHPPREK